jgi:hypothetical protein
MKQDWRIEPLLLFLFVGIFATIPVLLYVRHMFPGDNMVLMAMVVLMQNFQSAFFMRVNPKSMNQQDKDTAASPPAGTIDPTK